MLKEMIVVSFLLGAALASFLEVLADRLPRGERPFGRSSCFSCKRQLQWFELFPVLSWLYLRGRCRTCGARIPKRHILFELGLGLVFAATFVTMPEPFDAWLLGFRLFLLAALALVLVADLRFFIIPDLASLGLFFTGTVLVLSAHVFSVPWDAFMPTIWFAFFGAVFGAIFLGAFTLVSRGAWMGLGDVKLAAALGVLFGFPEILFLLAISFILGSVIGLALIVSRLRGMRDILPFGPFICLASLPFLYGFGNDILYYFGILEFIKR